MKAVMLLGVDDAGVSAPGFLTLRHGCKRRAWGFNMYHTLCILTSSTYAQTKEPDHYER
jgi:hypothetical protein